MAKRYRYTTVKQEGGDDGYCYVVRVNGQVKMEGLTRKEAKHYRQVFENREVLRRAEERLRKEATVGLTVGDVLAHKNPPPKPKKYYLRVLESFDAGCEDCTVRELEMCVDSILSHDSGRIMQFWRDVKLYGVDEAIAYVRNAPDDNSADAIQKDWDRIKERIEGTLARV